MQYKRILECLLASGAMLMCAHTAFAQVAPQPAEGTKGDGQKADTLKSDPNVVVVTANRVRSNAQTTAVALNVYNGAALADAGVSSVLALQTIDPSINVTNSGGSAYVAVRGVASTDITETGDPAVPVARDGFFTNRPFSIASSMYDVERVEVLKGPQGTLFGRNSTGGLINIITAKPGETFGGYLSADVGNYSTVNLEGAFNVPVNDKVQMRFSGVERHHTGYRNVTGVNLRGDDEGTKSGRLQVAFQPVAGFQGLISYQKDKVDDIGDITKNGPIATLTPIGDAKTFPGLAPTSTHLDGHRLRWEFSYDRLPWDLTLTYAGGYDSVDYLHKTDATGPVYPATRQYIIGNEVGTRNHEIRISTPLKGRFTAQAGYFYFTENNVVDTSVRNLTMNPGLPDFSNTVGIRFNYLIKTKSEGLFSQVGWKLTDDLKLTVGGRYSRDQKVRTGEARLLLGALVNPFIPGPEIVTPGDGLMKKSKPTYQVALDYTLTPQNFLYTKYAAGYKSGGFNSNGNSASIPYDAETVKSLEFGSKNTFLNRQVKLNIALFHQNYQNYQASQFSDLLTTGAGVFNVGKATIKGLETELVATVPDVARFDVNATLLNTHFGDGIRITDGAIPPISHDIGGNQLPNAPKFVMTAGVQRTFEAGDGELMARLSAKYSSDFYYSAFNNADERSPSYTTLNALLKYAHNGSNWEYQAYVNNLTDKVVLVSSTRNYASVINTMQFQAPRTYGVRVRYNF
ncbi:TonB-dependent receptor [Telluria mixta]|uniref:TonB-dependent receptor n=1 Tax=Telluria mixta TaxID=34071 RepID=A0ABT2BS01_9BURK|nr:TonB-dependent receptor [Telluria mixta]MCS0627900.1 TonB-dependent receptor [Telluria mixta]WEM93981.1 TonB-dependent receptor [Telluria mixta]